MTDNEMFSLGDSRSPSFPVSARPTSLSRIPADRLEAVERRLDDGDVEGAAGDLERLRADDDRPGSASALASLERRVAWIRGRDLPDAEGALAMIPPLTGPPLPRSTVHELLDLVRVAQRCRWPDVADRVQKCLKSRGSLDGADATRAQALRGMSRLRQGRRGEGLEILESMLSGLIPRMRTVHEAVLALVEVRALDMARAVFERHRAGMESVWGRLVEARLLLAEGRVASAIHRLPDPVGAVPRYLAAALRAAAGAVEPVAPGHVPLDTTLAAECRWVLEEFSLDGIQDLVHQSPEERHSISARSRDLLRVCWIAAGETVIDITQRRISRDGLPDLELGGRLVPLRMLREIVQAGPAGAAKRDLFQRVFGQRYNPEVHDRNVYGTIKRLRNILEEWCGERDWIVTSGTGRFQIAPGLRWRLVEALPLAERWGLDPAQEAVMESLAPGPSSLAEIEDRSGRGETTVRRALRTLLARSLVVRVPGHDGTLYRRARRVTGCA